MIYFLPNHTETKAQLHKACGPISNPGNRIKTGVQKGNSYSVNEACFALGAPNYDWPESFTPDDPPYYRGNCHAVAYRRLSDARD